MALKQGYLWKTSNLFPKSIQRQTKKWFVFVIEERTPFLYCYESRESSIGSPPSSRYDLSYCGNVVHNGFVEERNCFSISLPDKTITLIASTEAEVSEWIKVMTSALFRLGVLERQDNLYQDLPHASKLDSSVPADSTSLDDSLYQSVNFNPREEASSEPAAENEVIYASLWDDNLDKGRHFSLPAVNHSSASSISNRDSRQLFLVGKESHESAELCSPPPQCLSELPVSSSSTDNVNSNAISDPEYLIPFAHHFDTRARSPRSASLTCSSEIVSLKRKEVDNLNREKSAIDGIVVLLPARVACASIALVDINNAVWVAGWAQCVRKYVRNALLHIGDQLVSVNGNSFDNAQDAQHLISSVELDKKVRLTIRRLPRAQILLIRRAEPRQSLGFSRLRGTCEIDKVVMEGIAALSGLTAKTKTMDGSNLCNWVVTEVNNRPLNPFLKNNEVEACLNAVGLELTIVVQPSDFVTVLKKKLKKLKGYQRFVF